MVFGLWVALVDDDGYHWRMYPSHNLQRTRSQYALAKGLLARQADITRLVNRS